MCFSRCIKHPLAHRTPLSFHRTNSIYLPPFIHIYAKMKNKKQNKTGDKKRENTFLCILHTWIHLNLRKKYLTFAIHIQSIRISQLHFASLDFFYVRELMRKGNAKVVCIPKCWHNFLLLFLLLKWTRCWNDCWDRIRCIWAYYGAYEMTTILILKC